MLKKVRVLLAGALVASMSVAFAADDFPSRTITLVLPYSAGGTDVQYRKLAELASENLGVPVIVENKPGGGGTAAVDTMAQTKKPDGYTIAASTGPLLRQPHMMDVNFEPLEDFTWIAGLGGYTFIISVRGDSEFETLEQLLDWAKEHPGELTYGTPGFASSQYIAMATLMEAAGIEAQHIPYKGGNEIQQGLLGDQVLVGVNTLAGVMEASDSIAGIRALASFDAERTELTKDIPTVKELGYDITQDSPYGIVGPKGMDPEVVERLNEAFEYAANHPENVETANSLRQKAQFTPSDEYHEWAKKEFEYERQIIDKLNLDQRK